MAQNAQLHLVRSRCGCTPAACAQVRTIMPKSEGDDARGRRTGKRGQQREKTSWRERPPTLGATNMGVFLGANSARRHEIIVRSTSWYCRAEVSGARTGAREGDDEGTNAAGFSPANARRAGHPHTNETTGEGGNRPRGKEEAGDVRGLAREAAPQNPETAGNAHTGEAWRQQAPRAQHAA